MTPSSHQKARRATVALTRRDVENILVHNMGWEHEDVTAFWRLARRETREPGFLERDLRRQFAQAFGKLMADG